jgi:hypothetical protein
MKTDSEIKTAIMDLRRSVKRGQKSAFYSLEKAKKIYESHRNLRKSFIKPKLKYSKITKSYLRKNGLLTGALEKVHVGYGVTRYTFFIKKASDGSFTFECSNLPIYIDCQKRQMILLKLLKDKFSDVERAVEMMSPEEVKSRYALLKKQASPSYAKKLRKLFEKSRSL